MDPGIIGLVLMLLTCLTKRLLTYPPIRLRDYSLTHLFDCSLYDLRPV